MTENRSHWLRWHEQYEDPDSSISLRLLAVRRRLSQALEAAPAGLIRLISACAGDGRDVIEAVREHPRRDEVVGRLVELNPELAASARARTAAAGLDRVEVVVGDASVTSAYEGLVPADVVLVCGVFGNVSEEDIRRTIAELRHLCAAGATVIWTRHRRPPDMTVEVRRWFAEEGFEEVGFDTGGPQMWGVGTCRLVAAPETFRPDRAMFSFVGNGAAAHV